MRVFPIYLHSESALLFFDTRSARDDTPETPPHCETNMFSVSLSSSFVSSLIQSSSHRGRTNRSPIRGGITTNSAADVTREEGNDALRRQQRRQRGREEARDEEERATNARSRREVVLKILPTSGVALVAATTVAIGGFTIAHPSFAASGEKRSSVEEKELAKERRKAAVRAAAERAKETGVGGNAFSDSEYMVGEDHSPNAHSHQEEGSKGSFV